jgi:hypothetical protein
VSLDAQTLGEEILGAEIVAGKELTEVAGSLLDAVERAGAIWLQQGQWLTEDWARFWLTAATRPGNAAPLARLVNDRSDHVASGMHQMRELIERECVPLSGIWSAFFRTVARDWQSR